jgi:protein phosphatase PTC1
LDQEAVDLVRNIHDPVSAAKLLVDHALARFSTDNLSCMVVRFDRQALLDNQNKDNPIGVEGDVLTATGKVSEADKILNATKQKIAESGAPAVGVSASNSGRGHDPAPIQDDEAKAGSESTTAFTPTTIEGSVEEEPSTLDSDTPDTPDDDTTPTVEVDTLKDEKKKDSGGS